MASFNSRRGLNFSQYLENLNAVPTAMDDESFDIDIDAELALFTNTEFFDFENMATIRPAPADLGVVGLEPQTKGLDSVVMDGTATPRAADINEANRQNAVAAGTVATEVKPMEAQQINGEYQFPNFQEFNPSMLPLQSAPNNQFPPPPSTTSGGFISPLTTSPLTSPPNGGDIRTDDALSHPGTAHTIEEAARRAAEEDKRRRNTAASARFRVKKKQREQNLERTNKEISDKNAALENRVNQLELENRWLKNLITEKNTTAKTDGDLSEMFAKSRQASEERETGRKRPSTKKGVGTQAA